MRKASDASCSSWGRSNLRGPSLGLNPGSKTSVRRLDFPSTCRVSRTGTTVRGDPPGEAHESSDSPDNHGQPWERCSSKQADEHQFPAYMRRMSLRSVVEWAPREGNEEADRLSNGNTEDFEPSLRIEVTARHSPGGIGSRRSGRTTVAGSPRTRRSPEQMPEGKETVTRRAFAVEGSMVTMWQKTIIPLTTTCRYDSDRPTATVSLLPLVLRPLFLFALSSVLMLLPSVFLQHRVTIRVMGSFSIRLSVTASDKILPN